MPSSSNKRQRRERERLREEQLTASLFGNGQIVVPTEQQEQEVLPDDEDAFAIDRIGDDALELQEQDEDESQKQKMPSTNSVWKDDDDDQLQVDLTKQSQLKKLRRDISETIVTDYSDRLRARYSAAPPQWVTQPQTSSQTSTAQPLLLPATTNKTSILNIERMPDANLDDPSKAVVRAVRFVGNNLVLTAGLDKTLRFFSISDNENEASCQKIHGIHFPKLPIYSCNVLHHRVVVTGRRPFFYIYDMETSMTEYVPKFPNRDERSWETCITDNHNTIVLGGNDGYMVVLDGRTKQQTNLFKLNGSVRAMCLHNNILYGSGSDGDVYRFDLRKDAFCDKFHNEDGSITSSVAVNDTFIGVGAESGIVNLYNRHNHELQHTIDNLTTSIDALSFHPHKPLLALSSCRAKNALRVYNLETGSVFSNWPTSKTPLNYVFDTDWSDNRLAIGNDKGKAMLYHLK